MEEELSKTSGETPSEVRFLQSNLNHQSLANLIGFMVVDGVIPSYLSLNVMSRMVDFKVGATLNLVVESGPHVKDFWQRKIVVTVVNTDEEGKEKEVVCHQKTEDRKVLLWFEACPGVNNVSVTLYGQHIDKSPFIIPIGRELEMDLASLGLCFLDKAGERAEKEWSVREIPAEQDWDELTSSSSSGLSQDEEYSSGEETRLEDAGSRTVDQKDEEMGEWKVGESCLAKWSKDGVWYNVEIKECLPRRRYLVRSVNATLVIILSHKRQFNNLGSQTTATSTASMKKRWSTLPQTSRTVMRLMRTSFNMLDLTPSELLARISVPVMIPLSAWSLIQKNQSLRRT